MEALFSIHLHEASEFVLCNSHYLHCRALTPQMPTVNWRLLYGARLEMLARSGLPCPLRGGSLSLRGIYYYVGIFYI